MSAHEKKELTLAAFHVERGMEVLSQLIQELPAADHKHRLEVSEAWKQARNVKCRILALRGPARLAVALSCVEGAT